MKSKWKVTSNPIGDKTMYRVFRICDTSQVDHSGNREYYGDYMDSKYVAQEIATRLNLQKEESNQ